MCKKHVLVDAHCRFCKIVISNAIAIAMAIYSHKYIDYLVTNRVYECWLDVQYKVYFTHVFMDLMYMNIGCSYT